MTIKKKVIIVVKAKTKKNMYANSKETSAIDVNNPAGDSMKAVK